MAKDMKPFRLAGNIYFVGTYAASSHLIDTGDGLILIDTGYPEMQGWLIQSIWQLGFRPDQIRYIVHTHYHFDHVGSTNLLKQLSPHVSHHTPLPAGGSFLPILPSPWSGSVPNLGQPLLCG